MWISRTRTPRRPARYAGAMQVQPSEVTALLHTPYRIETERLVLRCFRPEDAACRTEALARSEEGRRFFKLDAPPDLEQSAAQVRRIRAMFDGDGDLIYAILPRDEPRLVGEVCLLRRAGHDAREIGYVMYEPGHGFATEAGRAAVIAGFRALQLKRMDLVYAVDNERSGRVAEKLGFVREGLLRGRTIPSDPTPEDVIVTSLLRAEAEQVSASWPAPRMTDFLGRVIA